MLYETKCSLCRYFDFSINIIIIIIIIIIVITNIIIIIITKIIIIIIIINIFIIIINNYYKITPIIMTIINDYFQDQNKFFTFSINCFPRHDNLKHASAVYDKQASINKHQNSFLRKSLVQWQKKFSTKNRDTHFHAQNFSMPEKFRNTEGVLHKIFRFF